MAVFLSKAAGACTASLFPTVREPSAQTPQGGGRPGLWPLCPRLPPGAAPERGRAADGTGKLVQALCLPVLPDLPGAQTAAVGARLVRPPLETGGGDRRTWRRDSGRGGETPGLVPPLTAQLGSQCLSLANFPSPSDS